MWVRVLVLGLLVAAVIVAVLWFDTLAVWADALVVAAGLVVMAAWWDIGRRHQIAAEMDRRAREQRRRPR